MMELFIQMNIIFLILKPNRFVPYEKHMPTKLFINPKIIVNKEDLCTFKLSVSIFHRMIGHENIFSFLCYKSCQRQTFLL